MFHPLQWSFGNWLIMGMFFAVVSSSVVDAIYSWTEDWLNDRKQRV
jgi:hypothetical protein